MKHMLLVSLFAHFSRRNVMCTVREAFDLPQWYHVFWLLVAVATTFADFKSLQLRPTERGTCQKQEVVCKKEDNGRQPDNTCKLIPIDPSKEKSLSLQKKKTRNCNFDVIRDYRLKKRLACNGSVAHGGSCVCCVSVVVL